MGWGSIFLPAFRMEHCGRSTRSIGAGSNTDSSIHRNAIWRLSFRIPLAKIPFDPENQSLTVY